MPNCFTKKVKIVIVSTILTFAIAYRKLAFNASKALTYFLSLVRDVLFISTCLIHQTI